MGKSARPGKSQFVVATLATGLLAMTPAMSSESAVVHSIIPEAVAENAVLLRERALLDNLSVDIVESLTTEVGPRRIGTDGDKRATAWAQSKFTELGFDKVWTQVQFCISRLSGCKC